MDSVYARSILISFLVMHFEIFLVSVRKVGSSTQVPETILKEAHNQGRLEKLPYMYDL